MAGPAGRGLTAPPPTALGIDIVDLGDPRCHGKAANARFVRRILSPEEAEGLARAPNPEVHLWSLWAAKEAAYKLLSALRPHPPVFRHATFGVRLQEPSVAARRPSCGRVRFERDEVAVQLRHDGPCLIALAWTLAPRLQGAATSPAEGPRPLRLPCDATWAVDSLRALESTLGVEKLDLDALCERRLTPSEARAVYSRPSALVRLAARAMAAAWLGLAERRVEVVCPPGAAGRMPPRIHVDGEVRPDVGVSLSHHGRWAAWGVRAAGACSS